MDYKAVVWQWSIGNSNQYCQFNLAFGYNRGIHSLRGRLKSWFLRHTAQHQPAHRNLHPGRAALRQFRIVFAQTPLSPQPAQRARYCPTPRQYRKTPLPRRTRYYLQAATFPPVPPIPAGHHRDPAPPPDAPLPPAPLRIHHDMRLAAQRFFAGIVTARAPFSVVFTDWRSIMAALGSGWRPSLCRRCWWKASLTYGQMPALCQVR